MVELVQPAEISIAEQEAQWQVAKDLSDAVLERFDEDIRRRMELMLDDGSLDSMQALVFVTNLLNGVLRRGSDMLGVRELVKSHPKWVKGKEPGPADCIRLLSRLLADVFERDDIRSTAALKLLQVGLVTAVMTAGKEKTHG